MENKMKFMKVNSKMDNLKIMVNIFLVMEMYIKGMSIETSHFNR